MQTSTNGGYASVFCYGKLEYESIAEDASMMHTRRP